MKIESRWQSLVQVIAQENKVESIDLLLDILLTFTEKQDIVKRMQIIELIIDGEITQREISKQYNISIGKITRGSNAIKELNDEKKQLLKKIINKHNKIYTDMKIAGHFIY